MIPLTESQYQQLTELIRKIRLESRKNIRLLNYADKATLILIKTKRKQSIKN